MLFDLRKRYFIINIPISCLFAKTRLHVTFKHSSSWFFMHRCKGVRPELLRQATEAPTFNNILIDSVQPSSTAVCIGVSKLSFFSFIVLSRPFPSRRVWRTLAKLKKNMQNEGLIILWNKLYSFSSSLRPKFHYRYCINAVCFKFKQNRSNLSYSCSIYAPSRTSIYQGNVKLHFNNLYMI